MVPRLVTLTDSKRVARVCQHQLSLLFFVSRYSGNEAAAGGGGTEASRVQLAADEKPTRTRCTQRLAVVVSSRQFAVT